MTSELHAAQHPKSREKQKGRHSCNGHARLHDRSAACCINEGFGRVWPSEYHPNNAKIFDIIKNRSTYRAHKTDTNRFTVGYLTSDLKRNAVPTFRAVRPQTLAKYYDVASAVSHEWGERGLRMVHGVF
jgi:hypothetical protein